MIGPKLTPQHPLWQVYIDFHLNRYTTRKARDAAKSLLFGIHYGMTNTSEADALIDRIKKENRSDTPGSSGSPQ